VPADLDRDHITTLVIKNISEFFFLDPKNISSSTRLEEDLSADALTFTDCIEAIESELAERLGGFSLEDRDLEEVETVGELVDIIYRTEGPSFLKG
jgi:acyl carrier protein